MQADILYLHNLDVGAFGGQCRRAVSAVSVYAPYATLCVSVAKKQLRRLPCPLYSNPCIRNANRLYF